MSLAIATVVLFTRKTLARLQKKLVSLMPLLCAIMDQLLGKQSPAGEAGDTAQGECMQLCGLLQTFLYIAGL